MRGFSLVELSIVLVILGLLTGGILAGQSLIRAAELRAVSAEQQRYSIASSTFRDKYFALAGDMSNATRFWNRATSTSDCATNSSSAVATPGTCDGDNNGRFAGAAGANLSGELFQFWRQLALAGLIEGSYSGLQGPNGATSHHMVIGSNIPPSKMGNAGWGARYLNQSAAHADTFSMDYGNYLQFGGQRVDDNYAAVLTPEEAWNIDTKMDDGRPAFGNIIARLWPTCTDAANGSTFTASYELSAKTVGCVLMFRNSL